MPDQQSQQAAVVFISLASLFLVGSRDAPCLLWLTAALQQERISLWVHAVFLSSVLLQSVQQRNRRFHVSTRSSCSSISRVPATSVLRGLSIASWVALLVQQILVYRAKDISDGGISSQRYELHAFAITLTGWVLWRWNQQRGLVTFPPFSLAVGQRTSAAANDAFRNTETESLWYEWKPSEVLQWLESNWQSEAGPGDSGHSKMSLVENQECRSRWLALIAEAQLEGYQLPRLTVEDWRSLGLPLGVAMQIRDSVLKLSRIHPSPYTDDMEGQNHTVQPSAPSTAMGWLEELDREQHQRYTVQKDVREPVSAESDFISFMDPANQNEIDASERASKIMKERFGETFELPTVRDPLENPKVQPMSTDHHENEPLTTTTSSAVPRPSATRISTVSKESMTTSPPVSIAAADPLVNLPPDILANMPPHIASIVRRNPALIHQVLASRLERKSLATISEDNGENNNEDDDEATELLRRRRSGSYKSIPPR